MTIRLAATLCLSLLSAVIAVAMAWVGAHWALVSLAAVGFASSCVSLYASVQCRNLSDGKPWQPMIDRRLW